MIKKIIWAVLELATIGTGTYIFVTELFERRINNEEIGLGAFLIVLGLLIRNWRITLFYEQKNEIPNNKKSELPQKSINVVLIFILSIPVVFLYKQIHESNYSLEEKVDANMNYLYDVEGRVSDLELLEERIIELEESSHRHFN